MGTSLAKTTTMAIALAALASPTAVAAPGPKGSITIIEEARPYSLHPLEARSWVDHRAQELVFDRLFYRSVTTDRITSRLVEKYETTDTSVTVHLKPNINWHDGEPLTPQDVCYTVEALLHASPRGTGYDQLLAGCQLDAKGEAATIHLQLAVKNPTNKLDFRVLPAHILKGASPYTHNYFGMHPIGTGTMSASMGRTGVQFKAYKNPHHAPNIAQISLVEAGDPFVDMRMLIEGRVQGIVRPTHLVEAELLNAQDVTLIGPGPATWWYIALNVKHPPLDNASVRAALDHAIDRDSLRTAANVSGSSLISGPFLPSSDFANPNVPNPSFNAEEVERQMIEAGAVKQTGRWVIKDQPVVLRIGQLASLDAETDDLLVVLRNQLQEAGFDTLTYQVTMDDWNNQTHRLQSYDLIVTKRSTSGNVGPIFHTQGRGMGQLNTFGYSNPEVDSLLERFDRAGDEIDAIDAYHELHALLAKDRPALFLWTLDPRSAWSNWVMNIVITPDYYFTEFDSWLLP